jgi:hypothetical protein
MSSPLTLQKGLPFEFTEHLLFPLTSKAAPLTATSLETNAFIHNSRLVFEERQNMSYSGVCRCCISLAWPRPGASGQHENMCRSPPIPSAALFKRKLYIHSIRDIGIYAPCPFHSHISRPSGFTLLYRPREKSAEDLWLWPSAINPT